MTTAWKDLERRICVALGGRRAGPLGAAVSDCVNVPFAVEVKRSSRPGPPVNAAWIAQSKMQAEREGKKRKWLCVVSGHNARRLTVTLDFGLFLQIAQRAQVIPITPEAASFIAGVDIHTEESLNSPTTAPEEAQ